MLLPIVAVLTLVSVVTGQDVDNCECISYFFCNGTIVENESKCENDFDVCCISSTATSTVDPFPSEEPQDEDPFTPEPPPPRRPPPPPPSPSVSEVGPCGKRGQQVELGSAIDWKVIGGEVSTTFAEFPWMVAVMKSDQFGGFEFLCGGSILYPNIILTAAHSVRGLSAEDLQVKAGVWDTMDPGEISKHQDRAISRIVLHPGFQRDKVVANDIAILVLNQPLTYTDNVGPVCLPSSAIQLNTTSCVATGWGSDNFGRNSTTAPVLRKVDVPIVEFEDCQDRLRQIPKLGGSKFNLHNSFICAGGDKTDTCKGDGGGPLMCPSLDDPQYYTQVGVTAWGVNCGQGPPGVYASVQNAADWIEDTVRESR